MHLIYNMDGTISYIKKENCREKERYVWLLTFWEY